MSVTQTFPYAFNQNGDIASMATGNKIHMLADVRLLQLHFTGNHYGGGSPRYAKVYASDGTTQVGTTGDW